MEQSNDLCRLLRGFHMPTCDRAATHIEHLEAALDWLMESLDVNKDYGPTDDAEIAAIIKAVQKRSPLSADGDKHE